MPPEDHPARLYTPWRYDYITGPKTGRKGVPEELAAWPGPNPNSQAPNSQAPNSQDPASPTDPNCVFCNLIASVRWGIHQLGPEPALKAGLILEQNQHCFVCLNRYPYSSGHVMVVPYRHLHSLAELPTPEAEEIMRTAQRLETAIRQTYHPDGLNLGMNLGEAAGAGIAEHLHLHILPRWSGDTNFMTTTAQTRILPELLTQTWQRLTTTLQTGPALSPTRP